MKHNVKISLLSIVCVFCATNLSVVQAASSIRSFGGSGTYDSASSAVAARTGSFRSASVRTNNSNSDVTSSTGGTSSVSNNASNSYNSRLSVGKYLSGGRNIGGGSSIKSQNLSTGTSNSTNNNTVLQNQIDNLETKVENLEDSNSNKYTKPETDDLLDTKQDVLTAGDGIEIVNGVISAVNVDGKRILLQSNGTHIQWKYDDATSTWTDLIALSEMAPDMANYSTTSDMNATIIASINAAAANYATAEQGAKADTALQTADLSGYALLSDLAEKANTADLGALAVKNTVATADIDDANVTKAKLATDVQTTLDKADTALQSADMSNYATTVDVNTALTTKADTASLGALATKNTVATADIDDANVTKAKLAPDVQSTLGLADSALQPGDVPEIQTAPADGSDYVMVLNNGQQTWFKVAY